MAMSIMKDGFPFSAIVLPFTEKNAINISSEFRPIEEYVAYINKYKVEQARIREAELDFLKQCPTLKYLDIYAPFSAHDRFDLSPLYDMPKIKSLNCGNYYGNQYGDQYMKYAELDCSRLNGLVDLSFSMNKGMKNFNKVETLKSMSVGGYKAENLSELFCSKQLDTLEFRQGNFKSLDGIENSEKMQCLYAYYNRGLKDISALSRVKKTLKSLQFQNCPNIKDFSVLEELDNLEMLVLWGNNELPDLSFLKKMKSLKTFVFGCNVLDGDLTPCLDLQFAKCIKNRNHYNLKDKDLPRGYPINGNEDIEVWRRLIPW